MAGSERRSAHLVHILEGLGVTHVVGIPDNTSAPLFDVLATTDRVTLVTVTREGEAFALASGLWIGGAAPLVVVQNTGLLEAGDSLRGTAVRMGAPLPIVVTARGYAKMAAAGLDPAATVGVPRLDRETLVRPDVDSVALFTEPTLSAWGIPFHRCTRSSAFADDLATLVASARDEQRPYALVLAAGMV